MSVSLKADIGGSVGSIQLNGADRLLLNADGTLSGTSNPATGLRSSALATMQKFADEFTSLLAVSGWQKLPSGLILQWGTTGGIAPGGSIAVTYPIAFPVGPKVAVCSYFAAVPFTVQVAVANNVGQGATATGMTVYCAGGPGSSPVHWMCIGN